MKFLINKEGYLSLIKKGMKILDKNPKIDSLHKKVKGSKSRWCKHCLQIQIFTSQRMDYQCGSLKI